MDGKVAVITGATSGIGQIAAEAAHACTGKDRTFGRSSALTLLPSRPRMRRRLTATAFRNG